LMRDVRLGVGSAAQRRAPPLTPAIPARSKCWGNNRLGRLGLGDTNDRGDGADEMGANLPSVDLGANWTVVEIAASALHTCARLENGAARALKCWGYNGNGGLGLGDTLSRGDGEGEMGDSLPAVQLGTNRSAVALALRDRHSCALLNDGSVKCWGRNYFGQLGLGDTLHRGDEGGEMGDSLPAVDLGGTAVQLTVGAEHTCALLHDGQMCAPRPPPLPWMPGLSARIAAEALGDREAGAWSEGGGWLRLCLPASCVATDPRDPRAQQVLGAQR